MNKICTSINQSKKLIELGVDVNTADMLWTYDFTVNDINGLNVISNNFKIEENDIPAWSLSALLDVIPKHIKDFAVLRMDMGENDFSIWYDDINLGMVNAYLPDITKENPIDSCVEMIVKLHEQKLLSYDEKYH